MNRALLGKEWLQARGFVVALTAAMTAGWFLLASDDRVLGQGSFDGAYWAAAAMGAGAVLAWRQLEFEVWWKTRERLVLRGTGPAAAFRAKAAVGALGSAAFAALPPLLWSSWQLLASPWAAAGTWGRVIALGWLGGLALVGWGLGALCAQARHGDLARLALTGGCFAGLLRLAMLASEPFARLPPWTDALYLVGAVLVGSVLALCAGRVFAAGVDTDLPLRDGPGLALALGVGAPLLVWLPAIGPNVSSFWRHQFQAELDRIVALPDGSLRRMDPATWERLRADRREQGEAAEGDDGPVSVFHPAAGIDTASQALARFESRLFRTSGDFRLGPQWRSLRWRDGEARAPMVDVLYDARSRVAHVVHPGEHPWRERVDLGWSPRTVVLDHRPALVDLERGEVTLFLEDEPGRIEVRTVRLPGGDELVGLVPRVDERSARSGSFPSWGMWPVVLEGQRGLYEVGRSGLEPFSGRLTGERRETRVPLSTAGVLSRFTVDYVRQDGLDPVVEVREVATGRSLLVTDLDAGRNRGAYVLTCAANLLHTTTGSVAAFLGDGLVRHVGDFDASYLGNPAVEGGRRPWLLALQLAFSAWLARRVWRETRAWGRSPVLGRFWVAITLVLGLPGWVLFRMVEPSARASLAGAREHDVTGRGRGRIEPALRRAEVAR